MMMMMMVVMVVVVEPTLQLRPNSRRLPKSAGKFKRATVLGASRLPDERKWRQMRDNSALQLHSTGFQFGAAALLFVVVVWCQMRRQKRR